MPTYNSTGEFLAQQARNWKDALDRNKVLRSAVITSVAPIEDRIQQQGQKSDGSQIGEYSNTKLPVAFFKKSTETFSKKRTKTIGEESQSYKALREKLGLQTEFIDFTFSGDMFKDFTAFPSGDNGFAIGFKSDQQFKIAGYLEKRFGTVFDQTESEKDATLKQINTLATKYLAQ